MRTDSEGSASFLLCEWLGVAATAAWSRVTSRKNGNEIYRARLCNYGGYVIAVLIEGAT
jgi:hypothetical protein